MTTAARRSQPLTDAIVGNPPFLGDKVMRGELGDGYTDALRACYEEGRVPGGADLVTYWFEKARAQIEAGKGIRLPDSSPLTVFAAVPIAKCSTASLNPGVFEAWSDEPWVNDGAAVRVSLVCFGNKNASEGMC